MPEYMDFAAIEREEEKKNAAEKTIEENFLEDLLEDIDRQEASELKISDVPNKGITSLKQAEYFIRRLKNLKKQKEEVEATAKQRLLEYQCKVKNWKAGRLAAIDASIEFVEANLTAYIQEETKDSVKKSLNTIEGTVGIKKSAPHYDYDDRKILKFLNEDPNREAFIKRTEEVRRNELRKAGKIGEDGTFYVDGKSVPGILVTYPPDKLFVR